MASRPRRWTIASARKELSKVLASAAREPQAVYRRDKLVATIVSPALGDELEAAQARAERPLGAVLDDLRRLCAEEGYELGTPPRRNRGSKRPASR